MNRAFILKESHGQLWDLHSEGGGREFFERWKERLWLISVHMNPHRPENGSKSRQGF
jgi:hypothetical protein